MTTLENIWDLMMSWTMIILVWLFQVSKLIANQLFILFGVITDILTKTIQSRLNDKSSDVKSRAPRKTPFGVDYKHVSSVFKLSNSKLCGLYFLVIGEVNDLKQAFNVKDDEPQSFFCKVGKSNDLGRRFNEHNANYGAMKGSQMRLAAFETVKLKNLSAAEAEMLKELAKLYKRVDNPKYNEVFVIPSSKLRNAQNILKSVSEKYI
jgi:predicted GIY-YIG superfamily endonuclease